MATSKTPRRDMETPNILRKDMNLLEGLIFFIAVLLVTPVIYATSVNALFNYFAGLPAYSSLAILLVCFVVSVLITRLLFALQTAVLFYMRL
jgi:hypothetical protein